jgi:hypothetical protein
VQVRQAGDRVLVGEPLHLARALGQQLVEPAQLPHRQQCETEQPECNQATERQQPRDHRGRGPLRLPGEPAGDAAVGIDEGLDLACALRRLFREPQAFEARGALEDMDEFRIDVGQIRRHRLQRFDRAAQRLAVGVLEIVVGLLGQHEAEHAAQHGRGNDDHRQRRHQLQKYRFTTPKARRPPKPTA